MDRSPLATGDAGCSLQATQLNILARPVGLRRSQTRSIPEARLLGPGNYGILVDQYVPARSRAKPKPYCAGGGIKLPVMLQSMAIPVLAVNPPQSR